MATTALTATAFPALVVRPVAPSRKVVLADRWVFIPLPTTASAVLATSVRRIKRAARDDRWAGMPQATTA